MGSPHGDLLDVIDWSCVECLNALEGKGLANALKQVQPGSVCLPASAVPVSKAWRPHACTKHGLLLDYRVRVEGCACRGTERTVGCSWKATPMSSCSYTSPSTKACSCLSLARQSQLTGLTIPRSAAVKLHSLMIKSADSKGKGPRTVKLFTNRPSLGFSEAAEDPPVQQFTLEDSALQEGATLTLK